MVESKAPKVPETRPPVGGSQTQRLYVPLERLNPTGPEGVVLTGEEAHYLLHVKRCRPGEPVELFTGDGTVYRAVVAEASRSRLTLTVEGREPGRRECPVTISVVVPVARGKRMDTLVEKLSELGVAELWPVTTTRSVVPSREASASRRGHWWRIATEAARQSGRATVLRIQEGQSLRAAAEALRSRPLRLAASLSGEPMPLAEVLSGQPLRDVAIFIGPEGDFDPAELQELVAEGVLPVSLGPTVLRVETAAIVAAAAVVLWADAHAARSRTPSVSRGIRFHAQAGADGPRDTPGTVGDRNAPTARGERKGREAMPARLAVTLDRLVADFHALGLRPGDRLALHSSLKSIGFVLGGPQTVIRALLEVVGEEGTLLMPVFSRPAPRFLMGETPSRTGLVSETFRRMPGVIRSPHPTHSVAVWGADAEEIARAHEQATGLGADSPFHRLARMGGLVVLVGCDSRSSSIVHVAEAIAQAPYLEVFYPGYDIPMTVVYPDGQERLVEPRENPGDSSAFLVVEEEMRRRGLIREGQVGQADTMVMKGLDVIETALALLRHDPASLLCQRPDCRVCPQSRELLAQTK